MYEDVKELREIFDMFDTHGNGKMEPKELISGINIFNYGL